MPLRSLRPSLVAALAALLWLTLVSAGSPHGAAFPGANGYLLFLAGPETRARLCVVPPRGGRPTALPFRPPSGFDGAAWSPSGSRIAYATRTSDGTSRIVVASPDGRRKRIAHVWQDTYMPAWSPDGRWIAFVEWWSGRGPVTAIGVVRATGPASQQPRYFAGISPEEENIGEYDSPAWSPDGRWVAYDVRRITEWSSDIYVVDSRGSRRRRLTADAGVNSSSSWSPDSRRIAFTSTREGPFRIYTMNADGTGQVALTGGPDDREPAWSPDGREVAFVRKEAGGTSIRAVDVVTRRERLVSHAPSAAYELDWQRRPRGGSLARFKPRPCR